MGADLCRKVVCAQRQPSEICLRPPIEEKKSRGCGSIGHDLLLRGSLATYSATSCSCKP